MAGAVKKVEKKEEVPNNSQVEIDALKEQLAQLQAQLSAMQTNTAVVNTVKTDRKIPFISLVTGELVLKGSKIWKIKNQFDTREFMEREANIILNNMPGLVSSGFVCIPDTQFIKDNNLEEVCSVLLNAEQLKTLFNKDSSYVVEVYKTAIPEQQKIITSMIEEMCIKGQKIDANILMEIGELAKIDFLKIEPEN